ncbi:uncharacterized protein B0H64DRAFT_388451 [Chaetomium fimeti]|uniref:SET domain-containing protein n=1 Tax=Chaetomium fimeti TaxID=1854472 RepID=A0AAE0LVV4_9PEZI|nr:hypothetical protein B0H64DRAFT_388451 [Chaetomium fimeti]
MKPSEQTRFYSLVEWSEKHGGKLHPSLEIYNDEVTKYSLRVKPSAGEALQPGFSAVTCPVATTLGYLNALVDGPILDATNSQSTKSQNGAFPPGFTQSVPPHVLGRFFLIKEYLKGKNSFWWPYLATLPSPDQISGWLLPAFWPDDDIAYLEGTNAHVAIQEMQANVKKEFKEARKLLKNEGFPEVAAYTSLMYKWAFAIFTSRSFRPSLILSDTAKQHVSTLLPQGIQLDDFSMLQPLLDIANHSPTAHYTWETSSPEATCTLVCGDSYPPGAQVFNNYGPKTNSELLLGYGFILPPTEALHNDYVHVRRSARPRPSTQPRSRHCSPEDDADDEDDDEDGHDGEPEAPESFLISLRPVRHRSSVVCRQRRTIPRGGTDLAASPCFAHFEPALLDDLATTVAPVQTAELVETMRGLLGRKVQDDYERLMQVGLVADDEEEEAEEEEMQEGRLPPARTANQRLAATYRRQYANVLEAALACLVGEG